MDKAQFDQLVTFLQPNMTDSDERRAFVELALHGCSVLGQIDWRGAAATFTIRLLRTLDEYGSCEPGKPAIVALLETLRAQVGTNKQAEIDILINTMAQTKGDAHMIDEAVAVGFLIEIGHWAKSELSEQWTIRRKQQHADLSNQEQATVELPRLIQDAAVGRGAIEAERTWALIQRKRDAVYRARNAKLADGEERGRQELTQAAYEERTIRHDGDIKQLLNEIEGDLESLGFTVERVASR